MNQVFVIGDIHGKFEMFSKLLQFWNPDQQQLILLGDLIDRGRKSYEVIELAKKLHNDYGSVILKGNHEELFLQWLEFPSSLQNIYYPQGGRETIHSFFHSNLYTYRHSPETISQLLLSKFKNYIDFLEQLPLYYEWDNYLFVHAGVNPYLANWKNTPPNELLWIRDEFYHSKNETGKIIVFGHTPTRNIHPDKSDNIWISDCKTKINIDGGAVLGGFLHGLLIDPDENKYTSYSLSSKSKSVIVNNILD